MYLEEQDNVDELLFEEKVGEEVKKEEKKKEKGALGQDDWICEVC